MTKRGQRLFVVAATVCVAAAIGVYGLKHWNDRRDWFFDEDDDRHSQALAGGNEEGEEEEEERERELLAQGAAPPVLTVPSGAAAVEQRGQGSRPAATLVTAFDGLGVGFEGPHGTATVRNPSDNSLAVGPDHVVQIVNSRIAIFNKTGRPVYGPAPTNIVFRGFGGACEANNNGDAVVRFDQLAGRWLIVMPIFRRGPAQPDQRAAPKSGEPARLSQPGKPDQPGPAVKLAEPSPAGQPAQPGARGAGAQQNGPYSMCYAISTSSDPLGSYYRYEFLRPLFPDYPRPAVWTDGYYVPTSTGDEVIQKHACVAERAAMLKGVAASEQCVVIDGVNFLNNADIDGQRLPPDGAPNIMMAAGGAQLRRVMEDDGVFSWQFHVDWKDPSKTALTGPVKIAVAPYRYLCDGQLSNCVPQPGTNARLDAQGDKIMARLVYRRTDAGESVVAVHSVNTAAAAGGVRWYEFRVGGDRKVTLHQQGTYAPDGFFRWMASPAIDKSGNIAIGYSFGGSPNFPGQRMTARLAADPLGQMTMQETIVVEGAGSQNAMRWEDYTQTAVDPSDDCTIWYVGDYIRKDANSYTSRIAAIRLPGCDSK
jgi:hypothetical protein